jgi:hypothetical protein
VGETGTVLEAVERFKSGALRPSTQANVPDHHGMTGQNTNLGPQEGYNATNRGSGRGMGGGMGRGMGGGMGRGMGGGMGCGRGRGLGRVPGSDIPRNQPNYDQGGNAGEVKDLRQQVSNLNRQIQELQNRLQGITGEKV